MSSVSHEEEVRRRLAPGTRVGKLLVRSVLGQGGTAIVYEAVHTRLRSTVALKVALVPKAVGEDCALRLEREARVCAMLDDPRIPKVFDIGELDDGRPYLVMEKVAGTTVEALLREKGRLPYGLAVHIACEVARALEAAHHANVVHRDLKPANVIVQSDGERAPRVHLMDFGVSKARALHVCDVALTCPGALVGTPPYMAPEQLLGEAIDARTDIYALGVLLYEMLSGELPFSGHSTAEVVAAVMRRDHAPLETHCPNLPPALIAIVAQAMAERPSERFPSAQALREALEACERASRDEPVPHALRPSELPQAHKTRRPWLPMAAALACGGAIAVLGIELTSRVVPVVSAAAPVPASASLITPNEAWISASAPETKPSLPTSEAPKPREIKHPAKARAVPMTTRAPLSVGAPAHGPVSAEALLEGSLRELEALRGILDAESHAPAMPAVLPDNPFVD